MHVMFFLRLSVCCSGSKRFDGQLSGGQFHSLRVLLVSSIPDHGLQNQSQAAVSVNRDLYII